MDGEIVALDHRGSPDFAGLQAALSDGKSDDLIFFAFDLLFLKGQDLRQQILADRKQALKKLIEKKYGKDQAEIRYVVHFESGGEAVLKSACRMSLEGIVSKQAAARYGRSRDAGEPIGSTSQSLLLRTAPPQGRPPPPPTAVLSWACP